MRNPKRIGRLLLHEAIESRVVFTIDATAGLIDLPAEVDNWTNFYGSQLASQNMYSADWGLGILDQGEYATGSFDVPYESEINDSEFLSQQDYSADYSSPDFIDYNFDPQYIDTTYYEPTDTFSSWDDSGQYQTVYDTFDFDLSSIDAFASNSTDWNDVNPDELIQDIIENSQNEEPEFYANEHGFIDFVYYENDGTNGSENDTLYDHGLSFDTDFYTNYSTSDDSFDEDSSNDSNTNETDGSQQENDPNSEGDSPEESWLTFDSSGRPGFRVPGTGIILAIGAEVTAAQRFFLNDQYGDGGGDSGGNAINDSLPMSIDVVADGNQFDVWVTVNSNESINEESITGTEIFSYVVHYQLDSNARLVPVALNGSYSRTITIDTTGSETIVPDPNDTSGSSSPDESDSEGSDSGESATSSANDDQETGGTLTYVYFSTETLTLTWSLTTVSSSYSSSSRLTATITEQFTNSLAGAPDEIEGASEGENGEASEGTIASSGTVNTGSVSGVSTFELTSISSQSLNYVLDVTSDDYTSYNYTSQSNSTVTNTRTATGTYTSTSTESFAITGTTTEYDRQTVISNDSISLSYQGAAWVVGGTSTNSLTTTSVFTNAYSGTYTSIVQGVSVTGTVSGQSRTSSTTQSEVASSLKPVEATTPSEDGEEISEGSDDSNTSSEETAYGWTLDSYSESGSSTDFNSQMSDLTASITAGNLSGTVTETSTSSSNVASSWEIGLVVESVYMNFQQTTTADSLYDFNKDLSGPLTEDGLTGTQWEIETNFQESSLFSQSKSSLSSKDPEEVKSSTTGDVSGSGNSLTDVGRSLSGSISRGDLSGTASRMSQEVIRTGFNYSGSFSGDDIDYDQYQSTASGDNTTDNSESLAGVFQASVPGMDQEIIGTQSESKSKYSNTFWLVVTGLGESGDIGDSIGGYSFTQRDSFDATRSAERSYSRVDGDTQFSGSANVTITESFLSRATIGSQLRGDSNETDLGPSTGTSQTTVGSSYISRFSGFGTIGATASNDSEDGSSSSSP
ncbi:MAG: hypothetical protein NTW52_13675 [Planctomycetota bacterium]|nr:hypothetical protein [Planctomycetota bacterium]